MQPQGHGGAPCPAAPPGSRWSGRPWSPASPAKRRRGPRCPPDQPWPAQCHAWTCRPAAGCCSQLPRSPDPARRRRCAFRSQGSKTKSNQDGACVRRGCGPGASPVKAREKIGGAPRRGRGAAVFMGTRTSSSSLGGFLPPFFWGGSAAPSPAILSITSGALRRANWSVQLLCLALLEEQSVSSLSFCLAIGQAFPIPLLPLASRLARVDGGHRR